MMNSGLGQQKFYRLFDRYSNGFYTICVNKGFLLFQHNVHHFGDIEFHIWDDIVKRREKNGS